MANPASNHPASSTSQTYKWSSLANHNDNATTRSYTGDDQILSDANSDWHCTDRL